MKYWIISDRQQTGPFDEADLVNLPFDENTPMWHDGLPDWVPAVQLEAARIILERRAMPAGDPQPEAEAEIVNVSENEPEVYKVDVNPASGQNVTAGQQPISDRSPLQPDEKLRPDNYLAWAIISTVLCCVPIGAVAIYYSAQVNSRFTVGDLDGAVKASERAQLWIMLTIVIGLISAPFQVILQML